MVILFIDAISNVIKNFLRHQIFIKILNAIHLYYRSCSYFNSNTLPLKINFIGSDNAVIPAMFKVIEKKKNVYYKIVESE